MLVESNRPRAGKRLLRQAYCVARNTHVYLSISPQLDQAERRRHNDFRLLAIDQFCFPDGTPKLSSPHFFCLLNLPVARRAEVFCAVSRWPRRLRTFLDRSGGTP